MLGWIRSEVKMKCPTPCMRCERIRELHKLIHPNNCSCRLWETCSNLVCEKCIQAVEYR